MVSNPITADTVLLGTLWQTTAWLAAGLALSVILERRPARAHGAVLLCMTAAVLTPVVSIAFRALGWGLLNPMGTALLGSGEMPPDLAPGRTATAAGLLTWELAAGSAWPLRGRAGGDGGGEERGGASLDSGPRAKRALVQRGCGHRSDGRRRCGESSNQGDVRVTELEGFPGIPATEAAPLGPLAVHLPISA